MQQSHVRLQTLGRLQLPLTDRALHLLVSLETIVRRVRLEVQLGDAFIAPFTVDVLAALPQRIHLLITVVFMAMGAQQTVRCVSLATVLADEVVGLLVEPGNVSL